MKRLEYVCTTCGRPFGRMFVAKRHLTNLHQNQGAITSVMDYMLGAVNGKYPWPSMPQNGNSHVNEHKVQKIRSTKDLLDEINRLVQAKKDLQEMKTSFNPIDKKDAAKLPVKFLAGGVCQLCHKGVTVTLANQHESHLLEKAHRCEPKQPKTLNEYILNSMHLAKCTRTFSDSFANFVNKTWLKGERYLYAEKIPLEEVDLISSNFIRTEDRRSKLKTTSVSDNNPPHYFLRAIEAEKGWVQIDEKELFDFIGGAKATAVILSLIDDGDETDVTPYLVALVPRYRIEEKKMQDELIKQMKEFGLGDFPI